MRKVILTIFATVFFQFNYAQFITTWETTSSNQTIIIPTNSDFTYNYDVNWGDGSLSTNQTGNAQHTYANAGTYSVSITGVFPAIYFNSVGPFNPTLNTNRTRIKTVEQWGNNLWQSMNNAFSGCSSLIITASDNPNLSLVTDMSLMFYQATSLTVDASLWDVSNVTLMSALFNQAGNFNSDVGNWDVSNVTNMTTMFYQAGNFNQDIGGWDVSNVTEMSRMFNRAFAFNHDIGNWDVSNVTDMSAMFEQAFAFNQNIGNWDVGNVTNMNSMFLRNPIFNQPLGNWEVSNVTDMGEMFKDSVFNLPISNWDTGNVTNMSSMFEDTDIFNQDISNLDVSNVSDMSSMFNTAQTFNQDIGNWDVSSVTDMSSMFTEASSFNQNLSNWDVSSVTDMSSMFEEASSFNQNLGNWNITNVDDMYSMLDLSNLSIANYDSTLIGWSSQSVVPEVSLGAEGLLYCNGDAARTVLISAPNNWSINDDTLDCSSQPFINILDPNFEQALIDDGIDTDGVVNGQMLESDAIGVTNLDVNSKNISDLTGIEFFTDLETLLAFNNNLSVIDVSQNAALTGLVLSINNLSSIDVSNNTNLVSLVLGDNQISSIDVSNNLALTQLFLQNNQLTDIDVSMLSLLAQIDVSENNLVELDLSQNPALDQVLCSDNDLVSLNIQNGNNTNIEFDNFFNATQNGNLTCIQVDDVSYSATNWTNIDPQSFFGLDCAPDNDDCSFALPITIGQETTSSTNSSTSSEFDPNCQQSGIVIIDVWFQFEAPDSGSITLTQQAGNFTVKSALYQNCSAQSPIACGENGLQVDNLNPGQTYYIQTWIEASISGRLTQNTLTQVGDFTIKVDDTSTLSNVSFENEISTIEIYPNPASQLVYLKSDENIVSYQLFDFNGKQVVNQKAVNSTNPSLDVNSLQNGIYFIKIRTLNSVQTQKLIIKN